MMATSTPRTPEQLRRVQHHAGDFHVNELASDKAGSMSPFGPDVEFPWSIEAIRYKHPAPADRPNLAAEGD
jgi:hypothetical protein